MAVAAVAADAVVVVHLQRDGGREASVAAVHDIAAGDGCCFVLLRHHGVHVRGYYAHGIRHHLIRPCPRSSDGCVLPFLPGDFRGFLRDFLRDFLRGFLRDFLQRHPAVLGCLCGHRPRRHRRDRGPPSLLLR